jgi:hypothetical protein
VNKDIYQVLQRLPNLRLCYPPQEYSCINLNLAFQFYDHYTREINIIREKLKERSAKIWREKINLVKQNPATNRNENKLRTY